MAGANEFPVTLNAIEAAIRTAARSFVDQVKRDHPGESLYGFLFEISCEGFSVHATIGTEEALDRFAESVAGPSDHAAIQSARTKFRWGSPEDAWYQLPDEVFDTANRLLAQAEVQGLYELYDGTLERLCIEILRNLAQAGTFGDGPDRERISLGLCFIGGSNSEKEFLGWARQVNPPRSYERLLRELPADS